MGNDGDHRVHAIYTYRIRREVRALVNPFNILDSIFIKNYRLSKPLTRMLVGELNPYLKSDDNPLAAPNTVKVLAVLSFYASGSYQAQVSSNWLNCIGRSTLGYFIEEVTEALNSPDLQKTWIKFPRTLPERQQLCERHQQQFTIPGIVGFIDPSPFGLLCDSNLMILNINASHAGASHDAFIYRFSAVRRRMREAFEESPSCWLLGDSGYPSEPWLLVPVLNAEENSPEEYFTRCHCKARNIVERCIGVLKRRFRCLLRERALHYAPVKAGKIVKACCLLHSLCRKAGLPDDDIQVVEGEENARCWVPDQHELAMHEIEDEEAEDPQLVITPEEDNLLAVGRIVRQRVVDFVDLQRRGYLAV